jgi:hypothetical protein
MLGIPRALSRRNVMTLCPIALVASCQKCPIVGMCPLKSVIGDYKPPAEEPKAESKQPAKKRARRAK